MIPTLESIAEQDARRAMQLNKPLFDSIMRVSPVFDAVHDRREDSFNDARDILAEQKRTRGDED